MPSDLNQFRDLYHKSVEAFIQGDPDAQKPLWSPRDDVTLANPLGPPAKGLDRVCQLMDSASAQISGGEGYTFDSIAVVETADLAYEVGIERNRAKLGNAAAKAPISLRVTTIFRREDREWKIVHRHADPITEERSIQSVAQPSGHDS
jgi:ketosteroid isomerase-like protein